MLRTHRTTAWRQISVISATILCSAFCFSVANAQRDGCWMDGAVENAVLLAAPWELPSRPDAKLEAPSDTTAQVADATNEESSAEKSAPPTTTSFGLELPWDEKPPRGELTATHGVVPPDLGPVDALPYPWDEDERTSTARLESPALPALELKPAASATQLEQKAPQEVVVPPAPVVSATFVEDPAPWIEEVRSVIRPAAYGQSELVDPWRE